jgi:hypothetical protein
MRARIRKGIVIMNIVITIAKTDENALVYVVNDIYTCINFLYYCLQNINLLSCTAQILNILLKRILLLH